ncbi:MAG: hypothetical protein RRA32_09915, partial [bacterium]|nr:hypothetical protein [bacterium]
MDITISLVICSIVLIPGLVFALFPRWGMRAVCRCASSYLREDLSSDPYHVMAFRFYGIAAAGLGAYALFQVVQLIGSQKVQSGTFRSTEREKRRFPFP